MTATRARPTDWRRPVLGAVASGRLAYDRSCENQ